MKYPSYPKYKPSGVEWLGKVPEHWEIDRFSRHYRSSMGQTILKENLVEDGDIPVYSATESGTIFGYINGPNVELFAGDLVIPARGVSIGHSILVKSPATCTQTTIYSKLLQLDKVSSEFVFYWMVGFRSVLFYYDRTAIPQITVEQVNSNSILLPPINEQRAIADFLDRETARLDTLVAKKQELIAKLKEKRTAFISQTVTRGLPPEAARTAGLNPQPKLKPSGIEWLGEVPEHWEVVPLKWHACCFSGDSIQTDDVSPVPSDEASIPVIGGNGVMGYANKSNTAQTVLAIGRVGALCGNVHLIEPPAWITDNALVLEWAPSAFDQRFIAAILASRNLNDLAAKTAQPLITGSQVRDQRVPKPDLIEQRAIADYLDRETAKIDQMVAKVEEALGRLQEYRTALITAAVTGKIDVRKESSEVRLAH